MTTLAYCTDPGEPFYPIVIQGEVLGQGSISREELIALLPAGENLRKGHYLIEDRAIWLGTTLPEGLLK